MELLGLESIEDRIGEMICLVLRLVATCDRINDDEAVKAVRGVAEHLADLFKAAENLVQHCLEPAPCSDDTLH